MVKCWPEKPKKKIQTLQCPPDFNCKTQLEATLSVDRDHKPSVAKFTGKQVDFMQCDGGSSLM